MSGWNYSINIFDHGHEASYSVNAWRSSSLPQRGWHPDTWFTGRVLAPVSTDPRKALRELLEALLEE